MRVGGGGRTDFSIAFRTQTVSNARDRIYSDNPLRLRVGRMKLNFDFLKSQHNGFVRTMTNQILPTLFLYFRLSRASFPRTYDVPAFYLGSSSADALTVVSAVKNVRSRRFSSAPTYHDDRVGNNEFALCSL